MGARKGFETPAGSSFGVSGFDAGRTICRQNLQAELAECTATVLGRAETLQILLHVHNPCRTLAEPLQNPCRTLAEPLAGVCRAARVSIREIASKIWLENQDVHCMSVVIENLGAISSATGYLTSPGYLTSLKP